MPVPPSAEACDPGSGTAEEFASKLFQQPSISQKQMLDMFELLPLATCFRGRDDPGRLWTTGAYSQGGLSGLRSNATQFPLCSKVLTKFAHSRAGSLVFTSVAIIDGSQASLHTDKNNHPDFHNWIHPLSLFSGGEVFVEDDEGHVFIKHEGSHIKGKLLPVGKRPRFLPSRKRHCVMDFVGRRCVLVAYCVRDPNKLGPEEKTTLHELGFTLPGADAEQTGEASAARPKAKAARAPAPDLQNPSSAF